MHSTWNSLSSSGGGLLRSASTVWTVESLLVPEQEVDSCCGVVWCIAEPGSFCCNRLACPCGVLL